MWRPCNFGQQCHAFVFLSPNKFAPNLRPPPHKRLAYLVRPNDVISGQPLTRVEKLCQIVKYNRNRLYVIVLQKCCSSNRKDVSTTTCIDFLLSLALS